MDHVAAALSRARGRRRQGGVERPSRRRRAPIPAPTWRPVDAGGVEAARGLGGALAARHGDEPAEQQGDVGRDDGPAQIGSPIVRLTAARAPLTREIEVRDEFGAARTISIPAERALTVFVDKRELVTLMTLGAFPELLVLGYLRNQRLVDRCDDIDSITVDWDVHAAAVKTRAGIERFDEKTAKRVVTTGCGQGTVFGDLMGELDSIRLPPASRAVGAPVAGGALPPARRGAQAGEHVQVGRLGARLRAVSPGRDADLRRGRRPPQRDRHHRRLDVAATT